MEDEGGLSSAIPAIQNLKKFYLNDPNKIQDCELIADELEIHNQEQMQSLQANETGNSSLNKNLEEFPRDKPVDLENYYVLEVLHDARLQQLIYLKEKEKQVKTELMQAKTELKRVKGEKEELTFFLHVWKKLTQENCVFKRKLDALQEQLSAEMEAKQSEQMWSLQANETGISSFNDPEQVSILGNEDSHYSSVDSSRIHSISNVTANHQNNENVPGITVNNPQENESNFISNSNANYNISRSADLPSNLYKNYGTKNLEESNISGNYGNEDEPAQKHVTKSISICASYAEYHDQTVDLEEYRMLEVLHNVRIRQLKYLKEEVRKAETELIQVKKELKHAKGENEVLTFALQGLKKLTQENYVLKRKLDALK